MKSKDYEYLREAYSQVYSESGYFPTKESQRADEKKYNLSRGDLPGQIKHRTVKTQSKPPVKEDIFDIIKGHLIDEGYADTEEAALAIMANMSEEWKQSIVEMTDFEAGGGNAKMKKTGMSKSEVEALGKKNLKKSEKSPAKPAAAAPAAVAPTTSKGSRREFERKAMAAGRSPVGYQRMLDAQKREKEYTEWEKKQPKPSGGYKGLAGS